MRSMALWLAVAASVAGGQLLARDPSPTTVPAALVCVLWPAAVALAVASARCGRARGWCLAIAVVVVAFVRGIAAGDRLHVHSFPAAARGAEPVVRRLVVREASWPGARCQVLATPDASTGQRAWLDLPGDACPLAEGDVVAISSAGLHVIRGEMWPGGVDPRELAAARGSHFALDVERAWPIESGHPGYWASIASLRSDLWSRTRGDDDYAFVVSSLYGVRSALSSARRRELGVAGLGHLIAVSGMQVSLVAWAAHRAFLRVLAPILPSTGLAFACSLVGVLAYVGLVGAEAPSVRAAIMVAALGIAATFGRPAHGFTVLAATSCVMLLARPAWVFDVGFQLSFAAMAAILRMPADAGLALQSWRVGWVIMPVIVFHFGETGAWAVPANAIAVPVFGLWVTPLGIVAMLADPWLGDLGWRAAGWGAAVILDVAALFAAAPRLGPGWVAIAALGAMAVGLLPRIAASRTWQRWAPSRILCVLVAGAAWLRASPSEGPAAEWIVFGYGRTPAVIVRGHDGVACVRDPTGAPQQWPPLLDALQIERVGAITMGDAPPGAMPPHIEALAGELRAAGRLAPDTHTCTWPPPSRVAAARNACAPWGERPFAAVVGDEVHCFDGGHWRAPMRLQSGEPPPEPPPEPTKVP